MHLFQSASLVGGTTARQSLLPQITRISIRVPRGRDDTSPSVAVQYPSHFNPRPSWEGRRHNQFNGFALVSFQSASLVGGTTGQVRQRQTVYQRFQSASLVGGTTCGRLIGGLTCGISIRVPRGRDDITSFLGFTKLSISIRVPRGRDDTGTLALCSAFGYFNPRPSWEGRLRNKQIEICLFRLYSNNQHKV